MAEVPAVLVAGIRREAGRRARDRAFGELLRGEGGLRRPGLVVARALAAALARFLPLHAERASPGEGELRDPKAMAKLYFRYSAMNAGKSTALLQVAHNYEENGRAVWLFTSSLDDRYGVGNVTSRLGPQRIACTFDETVDFYARLAQAEDLSCVLVDEAQFLSAEQVRQLH